MTSMRIDYGEVAFGAIEGMLATNTYLDTCSIEQILRRLIELRVSQINGCTYCIWLHRRQLSALGETDDRLSALAEWSASDQFDDAERAALEWAEAVTKITEGAPSDRLFEALQAHFEDLQIVDLTATAAGMNALNRMAISFRHEAPE